eukprot:Sdes_comp15235_c0_seq1m4066
MTSLRSPRVSVTARNSVARKRFSHLGELPEQLDAAQTKRQSSNSRRDFLRCSGLLLVFLSCVLMIYLISHNFPNLPPEHLAKLTLPRNLHQAKQLAEVLLFYKSTYHYQVLAAFFTLYIFLQTFAIPGSIFLSILSGTLFPFPLALFLVCFCSATGAAFCFLLSNLFGKQLVERIFPDKLRAWRHSLNKHRKDVFFYMLFLRITPFLPNWFINIAAPVLHIPLFPFFCGTFFGVALPSFFYIQMGTTLSQISETHLPLFSLILLIFFGFLFLLPVIFKNKISARFI